MSSELTQRLLNAQPVPPPGLLEAQKHVLELIVQNRPLAEILGALSPLATPLPADSSSCARRA